MTRVVVLTSARAYAEQLMLALGLSGIIPEAVVQAPLPARPTANVLKHALSTRGLAGTFCEATRRLISHMAVRQDDERLSRWQGLAKQVIQTEQLNSQAMVSCIASLQPEWLVLAETGIVKDSVLNIPTQGTLNAHPALLPYLRGVGVVEHAIRRNLPVGVTIHRVDAGIDTGPILRRRLVPVSEVETLQSLRAKANRLCIKLLAETVWTAQEGIPPGHVQDQQFAYCKWPNALERAEAAELLRRGKALTLYRAARQRADGDEILPSEDLKDLADV